MSDAKKAILARRAKFVAAALAGIACGKDPKAEPTVCLSAPMIVDAESPPPAPTPTAAQPPPEGANDASVILPPEPHVCLSVRPYEPDASSPVPSATPKPKPKPQPCLKIVAPKDKQG